MKFYIQLSLFVFLFGIQNSFAQTPDSLATDVQWHTVNGNTSFGYKKPRFIEMIKYIPSDLAGLGSYVIQKENLKWVGLTLASTAAIVPYDQQLTDGANKLAEPIDWHRDHSYKKIGGMSTFIPNNINSAVYYIGNGGTTLLLSGVFYAIGKIGPDDYRALNTSNELVEALLSVGVVTQTIKRTTGRQSPSAAIRDGNPGGDWNLFPSFSAYQQNTPNYDAMPSGHLATYTATFMIIATNYPEIKWIKPVGYACMGLLAFNMVSSKVHWTSDYPIAVLVGYVIGKNIANRRIIKKENPTSGFVPKKYKASYSMSSILNIPTYGVAVSF